MCHDLVFLSQRTYWSLTLQVDKQLWLKYLQLKT